VFLDPRATPHEANPAGIAQFGAIRTTASSLGIDVSPIDIRDAGDIEHAIANLARSPSAGLVVTPSAESSAHIAQIVTLAARYKLPAVYSERFTAARGGLISYGPERIDRINWPSIADFCCTCSRQLLAP
jgi:putative tryptophan/tyrosine transport system substrate-binding protein